MEINLSLCLPRDAASVPLTRRVLRCALSTLGVVEPVRDDVELALSEACGNVIAHADPSDVYEVIVEIDGGGVCAIDVVDTGRGYDGATLSALSAPEVTAEQGRGLLLIKMLTENAHFANHPRQGSIVHFEKQLEWDADAPLEQLR
jgi:serine/threonine-protein kinase RsbW